MRRIRLTLVLLSAALLLGLGVLVDSALRRVALESAMRHQAIAERVFDEMERSLSGVLEAAEEGRFDADAPASGVAAFPFLAGRFEVDPAGRIAARDEKEARAGEGGAKDNQELERLVADSFADGRLAARKPAAAPAQPAQVPGTTVEVGRKQKADAGLSPASELGALRALNKAVQERADRQRAYEPKALVGKDEADLDANAPAIAEDAVAPSRGPLDRGPMRGRLVDGRRLLLFRTAVRDGKAFREGVLVDLEKLGTWLREQALGEILAPYASLAFEPPFTASDPVEAPGTFSYRHRFAEPFAEISAHLVLRPLPGSGSATFIYVLAALLLFASVLGLAAVYRMVSVAVGFAERRSNFVAAVSHELKTPLTAIRMYGEMLRDGLVASEDKRDEYYRHITVESERLSRLINNVLEFSRLEKGTREVALTRAPVPPVVREVAELVRPHVEGQGFELALEIEDDLPAVRFDRDALMQVLWNLVDNAVKYARDGSPRRITLRCRREADGIVLSVRDHGPGVAPRHLERIFEPFFRVGNELSRRSKGTGLGLALVRGLVERMGGEVAARNAPDGGLEVEILLR